MSEQTQQPEPGPNSRWEHFSHDADIGIRGIGPTAAKAFEMAAQALTAAVTLPQNVAPTTSVEIECREEDLELLFLDWINAIIYEMDTKRMLFSEFEVHMENGLLKAKLRGEKIDNRKHDPAVDIKGATMTELKVYCKNSIWIAQCVVDV